MKKAKQQYHSVIHRQSRSAESQHFMHRDFCSSFLGLERPPSSRKRQDGSPSAPQRAPVGRHTGDRGAMVPAAARRTVQNGRGPLFGRGLPQRRKRRKRNGTGACVCQASFSRGDRALGFNGALGPVPWQNESLQRGIRDSVLALRELRLQYIDLAGQRDALLAEMRAFGASQPVQPPTVFVLFVGTGRRLDNNLSSLD